MSQTTKLVRTPVEIRALNEDDVEAFYWLRLEALQQEPRSFTESPIELQKTTPASIAARLRSSPHDNFIIGAFADDQLIGMAGFYRSQGEKTSHRGHIWGVYVNRDWRGQGVARNLLNELLRRARALPGLLQVSLAVGTEQTAARALYESLGFQVYGRDPRAIRVGNDYIDEDLMVLRLDQK
jgi:ribosomal protein S18 acetylase RimI-like enzyme